MIGAVTGDSRRPSRAVLLRRRALALIAAVLATAAIWLALFRSSSDQGTAERSQRSDVSAPVATVVENLAAEEQVDQVLLLGFAGTDATSRIFDQLRARQLGGVIVERRNWLDAGQLATLTGELRATALAEGRIPPLIVAAHEGGGYRSFPDLPPAETQLEMGDTGSPEASERWARAGGEALRASGFDLNLAPLADVATLDSPIADRAFSDDPAVAARMTVAALRGCRAARITCAPPHFPGLGAASQDTNSGPATVGLDRDSLAARDLVPFRAAFAERVPAIVLSLGLYTAYDPVTPAALAEPVATGLLRNELDYGGVAITDDLAAGAIRVGHSVPEAAVAALAAGADLLWIGSPAEQTGVREALLGAVGSGHIPASRLAEAAGRVLELKRARGLLRLP